MNYHVHSSAIIDNGAKIGEETRIWHFSHVCSGAVIGNRCVLGQNVYVANDVVIGSNVKIQNNVSIYDTVIIEDDVFCGPSMVFTNVVNPRSHVVRKHEYKKTILRKGSTIGANATIVCGNEVGEYAMVGAGAVVTKNIKSYALVVGNPAKQIGWVCQCGEKLFFNQESTCCNSCYKKFILKDDLCNYIS